MTIIVQKFGGTSLGTVNRIKEVANIISEAVENNYQPIVVVSAMAGVTNHLVSLCHEVSALKNIDNLSEYDTTISTGEVISSGLLALALQDKLLKARSISAWQLPIITNDHYTESSVERVDNNLLKYCIEHGVIPIITGFQGINHDNRITTIGRGGSDTTAVLVAAAMQASRCDIYTDVTGVFSTDPRIVNHAVKLNEVNSLEMLELASSGAKVLHPRSVELAIRYNIDLRVISSFTKELGTLITNKKIMEERIITGITYNKNLFQLVIINPAIYLAELLDLFAKQNIAVHSFNLTADDYVFIIPANNKNFIENFMLQLKQQQQISDYVLNSDMSLITLVGFGIKNDLSLPGKIVEMLREENINISQILVNEIKISLILDFSNVELAVKKLHELIR